MDPTGKISLWRLSPWEEINPTKKEKRDIRLFLSKISKEVFVQNLPHTRYSRILHGSLFSLSRRIYVLLFPQAAAEVIAEIVANTGPIDRNTARPHTPSIREVLSHLPTQTTSTGQPPLNNRTALEDSQQKTLKEDALSLLEKEMESALAMDVLKILFFQTSENIPKIAALPTVEPLSDGTKKITLIFDREGTLDMQQTLRNQEFIDSYINILRAKGFSRFLLKIIKQLIKKVFVTKASQYKIEGKIQQEIPFIWNPGKKEIIYPEESLFFTSTQGQLTRITSLRFGDNEFFITSNQNSENIAKLIKAAIFIPYSTDALTRQLERSGKNPEVPWTVETFRSIWRLFHWK